MLVAREDESDDDGIVEEPRTTNRTGGVLSPFDSGGNDGIDGIYGRLA